MKKTKKSKNKLEGTQAWTKEKRNANNIFRKSLSIFFFFFLSDFLELAFLK